MSLSNSKFWYSNNCVHFVKRAHHSCPCLRLVFELKKNLGNKNVWFSQCGELES